MSKIKSSFKESNRTTYFLIGLIISLSISWYAFEYKTYNKPKEMFILNTNAPIDESFIINTASEKKKKPKPKINNKKIRLIDDEKETMDKFFINPETTPDEAIENIRPELEDYKIVLEPDNEVFILVEEMPRFKGGTKKLYEYIYSRIKYPELAKEVGVSGTVYVRFIVRSDGSIDSVGIARGIGYGCDEEVLKMMEDMPNWIPGEQRGRKVNVEFNLPVEFKLLN